MTAERATAVGFAVVGLGRLALGQILPAFGESRAARLVALVSGDRGKAEQVAHREGVDPRAIYDYRSFDAICDDPAIEAVYIALPNHMHAEFTARAASAGKHVLCEKPMAVTSADAERMVDACRRARRKLMIAYRIQYEPHNRYVMHAVRARRFGPTQVVEGFNGHNVGLPTQWRLRRAAGGGPLMDLGLDCLNTCRFVLGEEPTWVNAAIRTNATDPRFEEVEESVVFQLGFPGGALGSFGASYNARVSRRYRCLADNGGWIGADPAFDYHGLEVQVSARGDEPVIAAKQQFALELDHFAGCIRDDKQPYTPGEEGLADLRIMEAIVRSAHAGKRVDLARIDQLDAFRGSLPLAG